MGMITNIYDLQTGLVLYRNKEGKELKSQGAAIDVKIPDPSSGEAALAALKRNQTGESDFPVFCREITLAGVYKWVSDLENMTCSYYDLKENVLIIERIPVASM